MSKFNENDFEQRLFKLKDSQDSIVSLSNWCLSHGENHSRVVATWLGALKKVKTDHRVVLFYLANDIIQKSKKKGMAYVSTFAPALQKATTMVRDPNVKNKILRIFKIWDERGIYDESFLVDLSSLLTRGHKSNTRIDLEDFQPSLLYSRLKSCQSLEEDTDAKMKLVVESAMPLTDTEKLRKTLKNRKASEDVILEINEGVKKISDFIKSLESEIKERSGLIDLLEISEQHYEKEFGEAKVVSNAYKCFTNRVKTVKKKLDEKAEILPSPVPTPSPTAPSPEPDPLDSSDDRSGFDFTPTAGGTSFLDGSLFSNQSASNEFETFYNKNPLQGGTYSPGAAFNGADLFPEVLHQPMAKTVPPVEQPIIAPPQVIPPPIIAPPVDIRPVFNYFRPIGEALAPPPPPPPPAAEVLPGLDQSSASLYNNTVTDISGISECSSEGLKIEVISSPTHNQTTLSSLLESMVSDPSSTLQPPPVPPNLDFGGWGETEEYWESPESPPLFEKDILPVSGLLGAVDIDMRAKDVDHRNLISLTGENDKDWDFPVVAREDVSGNEDMEMSDEDVGKIEEVSQETLARPSLDYTTPVFPILPIKTDPVVNNRNINQIKPLGDDLVDHRNAPVFQANPLRDDHQMGGGDHHKLTPHPVNTANPFKYPPPPPPPPPANMHHAAQNSLNNSDQKMWNNSVPPPPVPPQFDMSMPPMPQQFDTPPRNPHPNFPTPNPPQHIRFDGPQNPSQPIRFDGPQNISQPMRFDGPQNPMQPIRFDGPQNPSQPMRFDGPQNPSQPMRFDGPQNPSQPMRFDGPQNPSQPMRFDGPQNPSQPIRFDGPQNKPMDLPPHPHFLPPQGSPGNFNRFPPQDQDNSLGQPIPSFDPPPSENMYDRPQRPPFYQRFPQRFENRNFRGGGQNFFRGGPNRFQGPHPYRQSRPRFPAHRF